MKNSGERLTIGYIRVSSEEQAAFGSSLGVQGEKITQYAEYSDFNLSCIYMDAGISGKDIKHRDGMKDILSLVKTGNVANVIVFKLDRLGRNTIDLLNMIEIFKRYNVSFHSLSEKIDTETPMGKFFIRILASISELERDQISYRTKTVMVSKKVRGERTSRYAPIGKKFDENGRVVDNEEVLMAAREAKKIADSHKNWKHIRISKALELKGFLNQAGNRYTRGSVAKLLALAS